MPAPGLRRATYFVSADLACGALIRLLPDCEPEPLGIHAVYLSRQHQPQLLRTMVDFLADGMRGEVSPWGRADRLVVGSKRPRPPGPEFLAPNGTRRRMPKAEPTAVADRPRAVGHGVRHGTAPKAGHGCLRRAAAVCGAADAGTSRAVGSRRLARSSLAALSMDLPSLMVSTTLTSLIIGSTFKGF